MDMEIKEYSTNDYKVISQGNHKLSKRMFAKGLSNIRLGQMNIIEEGVILRGDLGIITIKNNSIVGANTVLRPFLSSYKPPIKYGNLTIYNNSYIGPNCVVNSDTIGSCSYIGENCVLVKI